MGLAEGIRKHGFRSWHERELLGSFAWMTLLVLAAIVAFAALEALITTQAWGDRAKSALVIAGAGAVGVVAMHRFLQQLAYAMKTSSQATCQQCETFGHLAVVAEERAATWVRVRCRKCNHEWVIS